MMTATAFLIGARLDEIRAVPTATERQPTVPLNQHFLFAARGALDELGGRRDRARR